MTQPPNKADHSQEEIMIGGSPAEMVDWRTSLTERIPLVLTLILLLSFAVLYLATGSVLLPLKATLLDLLSLGVMFGVMVWVFQEGHLSGLLGFTSTGVLEASRPLLMFCIVYGLSMDYEVFIVSRIREEYLRTGDSVLLPAFMKLAGRANWWTPTVRLGRAPVRQESQQPQ